jgi:RNA polymerase sigma factor (TIGR02999 family)
VGDDATESAATRLMQAFQRGETLDVDELFPLVYHELRAMARAQMADLKLGQTIQPTSLVHEAYLRLVGKPHTEFASSRHFFFAAARAMHDILIERARAKGSRKRDGARGRIEAGAFRTAADISPEDILTLQDALERLEHADPRKHEIVMLRFFAGLSSEQAARVMDLSSRTVEREWRFARAQLHQQICDD